MTQPLALAIHARPGTYSDRWIDYCRCNGIAFKDVDPFRTDFVQQVEGLRAFIWHWGHADPRAVLIARQITHSLEAKGLVVFPNSATCWHYDDKVGQKYLLEAIGAPLVPSYVFYDRESALRWVEYASFPKVFKLKKGAGSRNVRLVRSAGEARHLVAKALGRGFSPVASHFGDWRAKLALHRQKGSSAGQMARMAGILRRLPKSVRAIARTNYMMQRERGYVYFQDFIPDNQFDTRITIIGRRAFGSIRFVRKGDFRASGSGHNDCNPNTVDLDCVRTAFAVSNRMGTQALSFDFVFSASRKPLIVEISYACPPYSIHDCPGYWDDRFVWHEGQVWPQDAILEDLLEGLSSFD